MGLLFAWVLFHYDRRIWQDLFVGKIVGVEMKMNAYGEIVNEEWLKSFGIRGELKRDEFIVMPNHFSCDCQDCGF